MKKILFIAGTRPEAIKLAPLYLEMKRRPALEPVFCSTGQHAQLLVQSLQPFHLTPDITLSSMQPGQTLTELTANLFKGLGGIIASEKPDYVLVQGDTISAFAGGWSSFFHQRQLLHLEAGLRTWDLQHPYPEEALRRSLSIVATTHFAPTVTARRNLLKEEIDPAAIIVTGNTSIDALYLLLRESHASEKTNSRPERPHILVTGHRRENFGQGLENLCEALKQIALNFPFVNITYALHPNPAVVEPVKRMLEGVPNIRLSEPHSYEQFVALMKASYFLISDSGGIQEEAPALGKPVLVTREKTERPEAVSCGAAKLVGTEVDAIVKEASSLITDFSAYSKMATSGSPYGDGIASQRICDWLENKPVSEFSEP